MDLHGDNGRAWGCFLLLSSYLHYNSPRLSAALRMEQVVRAEQEKAASKATAAPGKDKTLPLQTQPVVHW
jgi:hypothetical protein